MVTIYTTVSGFRCLGNVPYVNHSNEKPRIFVAYSPLYHQGKLDGIWVDPTQTPDEMLNQIKFFLSQWPNAEAESYLIDRYQGFYGLNFEFQEPLEDIHQKAVLISKYGELGAKLVAHYEANLDSKEVEIYGTTPVEAAKSAIENRYQGEYKSQSEYATQLFDKLYLNTIPVHIQFCIDYERFKTAIFNHYFFSIELEGKTHVFFEYLGDTDCRECLEYFLKPYRCTLSLSD